MKLWIGARLEAAIAETFRIVRNEIEDSVNHYIESVDYGEGLQKWDIVINIFEEKTNERYQYSKKNKDTDFDLSIDYLEFVNASLIEKKILIYDSLLRCID